MPVSQQACPFSRPLVFKYSGTFTTPALHLEISFSPIDLKMNTFLKIFVELIFDKRYLLWQLFFLKSFQLMTAYGVFIAKQSGTKIN